MRFVHEWNPDVVEGNALADRPPAGARIQMSIDPEQGFWLEANRAGYEYLARFFAEIAGSEEQAGWHTHRTADFDFSTGAPEFTFGLADEEP